jgi:hypothetical protein
MLGFCSLRLMQQSQSLIKVLSHIYKSRSARARPPPTAVAERTESWALRSAPAVCSASIAAWKQQSVGVSFYSAAGAQTPIKDILREGDVSRPPGAASGRPVAAGGAEGGRVPPSRLLAVRWWCGSPSP